jgi:hypothetical protein
VDAHLCLLAATRRQEQALAHQATAATRSNSSAAGLAQFFPEASPVRIPVRVVGLKQGVALSEETVIEFGTPQEALFTSTLPLEFEDLIRLENTDGSLSAEAKVVAVQYHEGRTAIAARFVREIANWIIKR